MERTPSAGVSSIPVLYLTIFSTHERAHSWEPQVAGGPGPQAFMQHGPPPGGFQPGYQPAYVNTHQK